MVFKRKITAWRIFIVVAVCLFTAAIFYPFIKRIWGSDYFGGVKTYWSFKTAGEKHFISPENGLQVLRERELYFVDYWYRIFHYRTVASTFTWIAFSLILILIMQILVVCLSMFAVLAKKAIILLPLNVLCLLTLALMFIVYHLFVLAYADRFSMEGGLWLTLLSYIILLGASLEYKRAHFQNGIFSKCQETV